MSQEFVDLTAEVANEGSVVDSAVVAFNGLATQIEDAAGDRAASVALAQQVRDQATNLANAIPQNTPVTPEQAKKKHKS